MNETIFDLKGNKAKTYLILVLFPIAIYVKSLFYDFSPMDDQWMIIKNADILSDWKNIGTFFTKPLAGLYYRPLFSLSLMLDFQIGHTSPFIYHLSNLIYHLIAVILLYKLFVALGIETKTTILFCIIFSIHPALLHSVAWIPGRNDILLSIFALSSALYLIMYLQKKKTKFIFFHLFLFACAMLTKENAIILPLFFVGIIFYIEKNKKNFALFISSWLLIIIAWYFARHAVVQSSLSLGNDSIESLKKFAMGLLLYIGKTTIPFQQSVFPTLKNSSIIYGVIVLAILIVTILKFGFKNKTLAILGLILFFSSLIIPVWYGATGNSGEHYEQRIYLPLIGLLVVISQVNFNQNSAMFKYVIVFLILIFSIKTFSRMAIYKTENSFIEAGLKEAPEYYFFYAVKGDNLLKQKKYLEAITYYNSAIKIQPTRPQLFSSRGYAYNEIGKMTEAIADFSKSIDFSKGNPDMYLNRCLAYKKAGDYENALKDLNILKQNSPQTIPPGLEQELTQLFYDFLSDKINGQITKEPQNAELYVRRAKLYISKNNFQAALDDVKHACELEPNNSLFKKFLNQINSRL